MASGTGRRHVLNPKSLGLAFAVLAGILFLLIRGFFPSSEDSENIEPAQPIEIRKETAPPNPVPAERSAPDRTAQAVSSPRAAGSTDPESSKPIPSTVFHSTKPRKPASEVSPEALVVRVQRAFEENLPEKEKLAAIRALENVDDPLVVEGVMIALGDEEPEVRKAALDILKGLDDESVNDALLVGLDDDDVGVTEKAIAVMDDATSSSILPSLEKALMDSDEHTQIKAIEILEDIDDPGAVEILIEKGLLSENDDVFQATLDSLEYITSLRFESYEQARSWWDANKSTFKFE